MEQLQKQNSLPIQHRNSYIEDGTENYVTTSINDPYTSVEIRQTKPCPNCKAEIALLDTFCNKCGNHFNKYEKKKTALAPVMEQIDSQMILTESNGPGIVTINTMRSVDSEIQETGKEDIPSPILVRKKTGVLHMCDFEGCEFAAIDVC